MVSDIMEGGGRGYTLKLSVIMALNVHFSVWKRPLTVDFSFVEKFYGGSVMRNLVRGQKVVLGLFLQQQMVLGPNLPCKIWSMLEIWSTCLLIGLPIILWTESCQHCI